MDYVGLTGIFKLIFCYLLTIATIIYLITGYLEVESKGTRPFNELQLLDLMIWYPFTGPF